jgi:hypothetical protein
VLPGGFGIEFDDRHHMRDGGTERRLARYLLAASGLRRDLRALGRLALGSALLVNDSLHPAGLAISGRVPVVDVCGANLWHAALHHFDGRLPCWASAGYRSLLGRANARAFGRIVHTPPAGGAPPAREAATRFRLPPLVAAPRKSRRIVRAELGLGAGDRLAALYFNPHFRDAGVAARIEEALRARGFRYRGISEPWAGRAGWRAWDPHFADVVRASDLLVSGAGAAAVEQARVYRRPLLAVLGRQPEQALNLEHHRSAGGAGRPRALAVSVDDLGALPAAIARLTGDRDLDDPNDPNDPNEVNQIHALWGDAFTALVALARKENAHDRTENGVRPGAGDPQPPRWRRIAPRPRAEPGPPAGSPAGADTAAGVAA